MPVLVRGGRPRRRPRFIALDVRVPRSSRYRIRDAGAPRRQELAVEPRPAADALRGLVLDDLGATSTVEDVDDSGFSLGREGRVVRVRISAEQLETCIDRMEESAHRAMGLEPPWRSSGSLAAVHILAETAMAEEGTTVIIDDSVVRRDPPPA